MARGPGGGVCVPFLVFLCQMVGSRSFLPSAEGCSTASSPRGSVGELLVGSPFVGGAGVLWCSE